MIERNIDTELRSLTCHEPDPRVTEQILRRSLIALQSEQQRAKLSWYKPATRIWRLAEPVFSTGIVGSYLTWMMWTLLSMAR
jgi:hypothetical protein